MYCVGLTGNIASGKSTVLAAFQALGVSTLSADAISRGLTQRGQPALEQIKNRFGTLVIDATGQLNRQALRQIIFSNPEQRIWLENLLHPLIRESLQSQLSKLETPYCVIEIPLLTTRQDYPYLDRVLVVFADPETQIQRVMERDKCDKAHAQNILATQPADSVRRDLADDIIFNNSSLANLTKIIKNLHVKYLQFATKKSL